MPFNRVTLIQCDTALTPDQGTTSGAQSHPTNFNQGNLALAGATAREALLQRAATRLGVPVDQLAISDGVISVQDRCVEKGRLRRAGRRPAVRPAAQPGGEAASLRASGPCWARRCRASSSRRWSPAGSSIVHNVRVPGMLHGRVVRPPAVGATLVSVDESSVAGMPGVVKVVVKKNFVGVVAEKPWQAIQAAAKLKATWTPGVGLPSQRGFHDYLRNQKPTRDTLLVNSKDVDETIGARRDGRQGDLPVSVSDARIDRQRLRRRRRAGRQGHHLVAQPRRFIR